MAERWKSLALLGAGALASVLGGLLFPHEFGWVLGAIIFFIFLFLYGSGAISWIRHFINIQRRKGNRIGILNDMGWDPKSKETCGSTNLSPDDWKTEIEKQAKENKCKIKVQLIDVKKNFDSYTAILNPYGSVYLELDVKNFVTLNKILNYVNEKGLFINVADVPGYWAYNPLIKRKLDATPPIYISPIPARPFELTPFMEKLGLRVLNTEKTNLFDWKVEFEDEFNSLSNIDMIKVHRVVIVEKNVKGIIKPKDREGGSVTPLFLVDYGGGKVLISLLHIYKQYSENDNIKEILAKIIIKLLSEKK